MTLEPPATEANSLKAPIVIGSSECVRPTATSEEIYGITKQPPPTCPLIDEALKEVERCQKRIMRYEKSDEDELRDMLSDVESNLGSVSGYGKSGLLEDIRERVEAIRAWGEEWKQLALEHAPKPDETESA